MMTLSAYDHNAYHKLGEVEEVAKMVNDSDIRGMGEIIVNHGYEKSVNVALAHRHFGLSSDEVMLETSEGDVRIAKPVELDQLSSINAQPSLIIFGSDNLWRPVQFGVGEMPAAWNDAEFLKDIAVYLIKNNLQDKLMLAARDAKKVDGLVFLENNDDDTRTSETTLVGEADLINATKTTYGFICGQDCRAKLMVAGYCAHTVQVKVLERKCTCAWSQGGTHHKHG